MGRQKCIRITQEVTGAHCMPVARDKIRRDTLGSIKHGGFPEQMSDYQLRNNVQLLDHLYVYSLCENSTHVEDSYSKSSIAYT